MQVEDKAEITEVNIWKKSNHLKIYNIYNPPGNNPNLDVLNTTSKTLITGDFNAHHPDWGYTDINNAGHTIKDYVLSNGVELLYNTDDTPTYLHYNGTTSNPDLTLASTDIIDRCKRNIISDPGLGHRAIIYS